jgi:hypothetical protein
MMPEIIIIEIAKRFIPLASGNMKIKDEFYYVFKVVLNWITAVFNHKQANANMLHLMIFVKKLEVADTVGIR